MAFDAIMIPIRKNADWYARGVGGAAAREIKDIYQPATCLIESMNWRAGMSRPPTGAEARFADPPDTHYEYALAWFGFAGMLAFEIISLARKRLLTHARL